ncbi:MAG: 50S ribosomal protein L33 [Legionellales bacterium]|nr:50S ribosomal protein L33 [Legionellales bacterium]OUX67107.1 MAG: 50S ribosomal protein L33 [bacterium TMED178]|tara:strand:- start:5379 stop:5552 length:174 start_codon:yes stop_codon:yes gene_type:complete
MAKKSNSRVKIKLVSSEGTGYFYTTYVNQRNMESKLKLKKYDRKLRKHVIFNEEKLK